ncbi:MAG: glycosyltransferase family 39 protein, partial [Phycisphaerales bacterium]
MSSGHHISVGSQADCPAGDSRRITLLGSWTGSWRGGVLLVLLCLSVLLPGLFSLPPFDRDEPRFAQASRQMWQTGDWIVPRVQDRPRLNKPPLIYWLQASSAKVFGAYEEDITTPELAAQNRKLTRVHDAIWMYRVPGVLCTIASVLLTWGFGKRLFDSRVAWLGAAMLAVCPLVVIDAHQARADQLLLATVVATQWAVWNVLTSQKLSSRWFWRCIVLGACMGVSILAKGPIAPMIAALTSVFWIVGKNGLKFSAWKNVVFPAVFGTFIVSLVAVVIAIPWVLAVARTVGYGNYITVVIDETVGRAGEAKEGHSLFPGFHLIALVALFFPGSMLAGTGVIDFFRRGWVSLREVDGPGPLW